jgi:hypothetical protein
MPDIGERTYPPSKPLPKGMNCSCGKYWPFDVYVYAHWDLEMRHTCDECGREVILKSGRIRVKKEGKHNA